MSSKLEQGEPVLSGIQRVVRYHIDQVLKSLSGKDGAVSDRAIHTARKHFKEIRAALRLVRDELGEQRFERENHAFRDAGHPLSAVRDAKALLNSLDDLISHSKGRVKPHDVAGLRRVLQKRRRAMRRRVLKHDHALATITRTIRAARGRTHRWPGCNCDGKAVERGLQKTYSRGRRSMKKAHDHASDEALHQWRKRAKDLRYELELLEPLRPKTINPPAEQARELTGLLGDDHDLAVLKATIREECRNGLSIDEDRIGELIDRRRNRLQKEAGKLGRKLYADHPRKFVNQLNLPSLGQLHSPPVK